MGYVKAKDVLEELKISRSTLYRLVQEGMPCKKESSKRTLYDIDQVKEFMARRAEKFSLDLKVGEVYTNEEICKAFKCSPQGGMRKSNTTNCLVLFCHLDNPDQLYHDTCKDGIIYYTGEGQVGDQSMTKNNKTLKESPINNVRVYLFETFEERRHRFRGGVKLDGKITYVQEKDINGNMRNVFKFPLRPIDESDSLSQDFYDNYQKSINKKVEAMDKKRIADLARDINQQPSELMVTVKKYNRNPVLARYVKSRANGKCELCGEPAPFTKSDGTPYLESHHIIPVSEGGVDAMSNCCALCPNCHRRVHVLNDPRDIDIIRKNIAKDEAAAESSQKEEKAE